jgi:lysophospholipase L1-like esterase
MIRILCVLFTVLTCAPPVKRKVRVYLIGDSTVANYEPSRSPLAGWGMPFAQFFDSTVDVQNHARGGRSTRTFLQEGRWKPIVDSLQRGDYVLIQFGHNDGAKEEKYKDRYTPLPDYRQNLKRFIAEAKSKGATAILITPVSRMRFDKEGGAQPTHEGYSEAVIDVAVETGTPLIDLDRKSRALIQSLGPRNAPLLFMQLGPGEHPHYPEGQKDNTHFNEYGARRMAQLVLEGLRENKLPLVQHLVTPKTTAK